MKNELIFTIGDCNIGDVVLKDCEYWLITNKYGSIKRTMQCVRLSDGVIEEFSLDEPVYKKVNGRFVKN